MTALRYEVWAAGDGPPHAPWDVFDDVDTLAEEIRLSVGQMADVRAMRAGHELALTFEGDEPVRVVVVEVST